MLRRRILASAMASVMALSSVAVIANADETKTTKDKADLKALVESFEDIRNKDIYEKGSVSAERFLGALEYAENVLADPDATAKDYTAAYLMVEALKNMDSYTAAQLADLIKKWQGVYDKQNILNDEIGDSEYDNFDAFQTAFDAATKYVNSDDVRLTTDAYLDLEAAAANLSKKAGVKKSEFRTALKAYEAIIGKVNNYDTWRRGTISHGKIAWGASKTMMYYDLYEAVMGNGVAEDIKGDTWDVLELGTKKMLDGTAAPADALVYIRNMYDEFDQIKSASYTTNDEILAAYKTCLLATEVFNAWTVDATTRANKAKVDALLKQYHSQIVAEFKATSAEALYTVLGGDVAKIAGWTDAAHNYAGAAIKSPNRVTITVDADGYYDPAGTKNVVVAKNSDILRFIKVTSADVTGDLKDLMEIAELYADGKYDNDVYNLDTIGQVKVANGSVTEYTLIYRALSYVLSDMYPGYTAPSTKKLSDLEQLIADAYELAEKTGDAAIFNDRHMATVDMRKLAILFVAEYKAYGDEVGVTIDEMYNQLKTTVDNLQKQYDAYKYSYAEIRDEMYAVAQDLDNGAIKDTAKIAQLLSQVAKDLSILEASDDDLRPNQAFTKDRIFQPINRLQTGNDPEDGQDPNGFEKALTASFEALKAAVKADKEASQVVKGDVNGDGKVTAADATEILKAVIGLRDAIATEVGDMNGDGAVTSADATEILKAQIGL
ncbi:MAG: dockerin type I repeat-containing protein [Oscillospiraceae bacterium]|nr:dockerin type I repeat-containing protein [Oscillospiraceae bacterium]